MTIYAYRMHSNEKKLLALVLEIGLFRISKKIQQKSTNCCAIYTEIQSAL